MPRSQEVDLTIIGNNLGGQILAELASNVGLSTYLFIDKPFPHLVMGEHYCRIFSYLIKERSPLKHRSHSIEDKEALSILTHCRNLLAKQYFPRPLHDKENLMIIKKNPTFRTPHLLEWDGNFVKTKQVVWALQRNKTVVPEEWAHFHHLTSLYHPHFLKQKPKSLAIFGENPICLVTAQCFARLGTRVFLISSKEKFPIYADKEIFELLKKQFCLEGIVWIESSQIDHISEQQSTTLIHLRERNQLTIPIEVEKIFIHPKKEFDIPMDFGKIPFKISSTGAKVNASLQTNFKHMYAIGETISEECDSLWINNYQAQSILHNILHTSIPKEQIPYPHLIYTDPPLIFCGQREAIEGPLSPNKRIIFEEISSKQKGRSTFLKLIIQKNTILGLHLYGPLAEELYSDLRISFQPGTKISNVYPCLGAYNRWAPLIAKILERYYAEKYYETSSTKRHLVKKIFNASRLFKRSDRSPVL